MKRFLANVCLLCAFFALFVACGNDKSSSPKDNSISEYENMQDLTKHKCSVSTLGEKAFVKNKGVVYECNGDKWVESYVQSMPDSCMTCEYGELTDSRDGKVYKTVKIGSKVWMAENLNYEADSSYCYNDSTEYCDKYGRLYVWQQYGLCPSGSHMPDTTEWHSLFSAVGESPVWGMTYAGRKLKSRKGWENDGGGSDAYGFTALPAGYRLKDGTYDGLGKYTDFWSSRSYQKIWAWIYGFDYDEDHTSCISFTERVSARSVRCVVN
jgi:uncharacterized protein (TIGR02145 family)